MTSSRSLLLKACTVAALLGAAVPSYAGTILGYSPDPRGFAFLWVGGTDTQIVSTSWSQTSDYTDVSITAYLRAALANESVTAWLTTQLPESGTPLATATVAVPTGAYSDVTLFSGLTLGAGQYYLTLFSTDASVSRPATWKAGTSGTFDTGVTPTGTFYVN
jgi:hypothetical protein